MVLFFWSVNTLIRLAIWMSKLTHGFTLWLFGLDRWKKRLLQIAFDVAITPFALLLAFFMRLETTAYLYQLDTYIGVLIAIITTLAVFAARGIYDNFARHISIETANSIIIGCLVSCAALLSATLLLELQIPRSVPLIYATILCFFFNGCTLFNSCSWPKHHERKAGKCRHLWSRCRRHPTDGGNAKEPELSRQVFYRRRP